MAISANRYKIEDCFRVLKTNFSARPVFHRTKEHITAHFLICYTALLVFRLMEAKLEKHAHSLKEPQHYTTLNIIETLKNMNVMDLQGMYYASTYEGSQVLDALNAVWNLKLDRKYYLPKDLNKTVRSIL